MNKLLNNFLWLFASQFFNTLVNFLFAPFLSRSLSYDEYAIYGQVNIITDLSVSVLSLGISSVIISYLHYSKTKEKIEEQDVYNGALRILLLLGIIGMLSVFFSGSYFSMAFGNSITHYLQITSFNIPILLLSNVFNAFLIFGNSFRKISLFLLCSNLLRVSMVFISIQYFHNLEYVFVSVFIANTLLFICYFTSMPYKIVRTTMENVRKIRNLVTDGFVYYLTGLLGVLLFYVDGIIVSSVLTNKDFSIYRNGAFELPLISTIYSTIGMIILPEVSKLFAESQFEKIIRLKSKVINSVACVVFPVAVFVFLFNKELIVAYLGNKYEASSTVFWIYNILLLVRINDYADILIASRNYTFLLKTYLFTFLVNVLICFILTYYFGIIGAVVSTVLSVLVVAFFQSVKTAAIMGTNVNGFFQFGRLARIFAIPMLMSAVLKFALDYTLLPDLIKLITGAFFIIINYYIYIKLNYMDENVVKFAKDKLNKYGLRFIK